MSPLARSSAAGLGAMAPRAAACLATALFVAFSPQAAGAQAPGAAGESGKGPEAAIERAYRECFRTFFVDGRLLTLRMPFAEDKERSELADAELKVEKGGKGDPAALWRSIEAILARPDFASYLEALSDGREKLVEFDIAARSWSIDAQRFAIERNLSGKYTGLPHKPVVLSSGRGAGEAEVYDYLYCVGRVGIDCSGFVWHILRALGAEEGVDIDELRRREAKLPARVDASLFVGAGYFDPKNDKTRKVPDEIEALRPGDIILFRGEDGSFIHSAVIQSIDLASGRLRYLQSTDECPRLERGVHDSTILFDPARPKASLADPSHVWLQRRGAAFEGEPPSPFADDGERYRAYAEQGGSIVVRLKSLEKAAERLRQGR
jgi:hypothetical protein